MIRRSTLSTQLFVAVVILAAAVVAGCAAKKALWGDPETGLILTYRMAKDQVVKYESLNELNPDMSTIVGKSFAMSLSPLGEELDVSSAEVLTYTIGPGGERSVGPDFQTIFPNVAGKPVKIGDTWTSMDTLDVKEGDSNIKVVMKSVNTLKALEAVSGLECARVEAVVTGTLSGTGQQGGATLTFEGDIAGTDVWHFAYKEGLFVKMVSEATVEGNITTSGPQSMDIPMTQTMKFETSLVPQPM
jgi:hypothetical protein